MGNIIAFNAGSGVVVIGAASTGNAIRGNAIHHQGGLEIDLGLDGVTPNDLGDPDTGPNNLLNFPVLNSTLIVGSTLTVMGTLNSAPNAPFTIEFFASAVAGSDGNGETFLGSITVTSGADGNASFTLEFTGDFSNRHFITATTIDAAGNTSEFSQVVNAANDAPTLATISDPAAILEDAGLQTINLTGISAGPGESQTLTVTATSSNTGLIANPTVTYTSPDDSGTLTYTPVADQSGTAVVTVTITDNGGTANGGVDTFTRTFSVKVNEVNDPPIGVNDPLASVAEDSGLRTLALATLLGNDSRGPTNENGQTVTITDVSDAVGGTVSISGSSVLFTPTANYNGPASFVYTLRDDGTTNGVDDFLTSTATVSFTITEVNDPTVGVDDPLASVAEDSGVRTLAFATLLGNDSKGPNEGGQTLTISAVSDPVGGTVSISGSNVFFAPTANYNGPASFVYTLWDDGTTNGGADFLTSTATVSFTITEVNDPPAGVDDPLASVAEDSGLRTIPFATLLGNDTKGPNEGGQTLTISAVSDPVGGTISISGSNVLFTPSADYNGPASFVYTLQDDGTTAGVDDYLTSTATVSFTITKVNDAPSFTKGSDLGATDASSAQTITAWATDLAKGPPTATDEAGQILHFVVTNDNNGLFVNQPTIDATGKLTFTPKPNAFGLAKVEVVLMDDSGTADGGSDSSSPQTFEITITKMHPWQNSLTTLDVNRDREVSPIDALLIINGLNAGLSGRLPAVHPASDPYLDTSGDDNLSPIDALLVINYLNDEGNPGGEGEASILVASHGPAVAEDASSLAPLSLVLAEARYSPPQNKPIHDDQPRIAILPSPQSAWNGAAQIAECAANERSALRKDSHHSAAADTKAVDDVFAQLNANWLRTLN